MKQSKEEQILREHFKDLIQLSYHRSIPKFSHFVSIHEMELAYEALKEFYENQVQEGRQFAVFGGYKEAERKVICFLPQEDLAFYEPIEYPIQCVEIAPANKRFCDPLNHRDYLGAIMNLGITRDQVGDILVTKDAVHKSATAYVFCKEDKAALIASLERIKHTTVAGKVVNFNQVGWKPEFQEISGSVSSFRMDSILALAVKTSRSQGLALIQGGNVSVNGRCCTENAKKLEEGDVFSVRGYGKFIFEKTNAQSKKGRYHIIVKKYI